MLSEQTLMVANSCNLKCTYCYYETGASSYRSSVITPAAYENWLSACAPADLLDIVQITGGEPLLRDDILDIAAIAAKYARQTAVFSNGILLTDDHIKEFAALGCELHISLDHLSQGMTDNVRGGTKATRRALDLLAAKADRMRVRVCVVVTAANIGEIEGIAAFARTAGFGLELIPIGVPDVHPLSLTTAPQEGRHRLADQLAQWSDILAAPRYYRRLTHVLRTGSVPPVGRCSAGTRGVFVDSDGEVYVCPQRLGVPLGNILSSPPTEVADRKAKELKSRAAGPCASLECLVLT